MIALLPWGRAARAVEELSAAPSVARLAETREALDELARRTALPGVRKRLEELEKGYLTARAAFFESAIASGRLEEALRIHEDFAVPTGRTEERIGLAEAAVRAGVAPPTLEGIQAPAVKWERRSVFFDLRAREASNKGDDALEREILNTWIQHDPIDSEPRARLVASCIRAQALEEAYTLLAALADEAFHARVLERLLSDATLPRRTLAYLCLRLGRDETAEPLIDEILASSDDIWAITEKGRLVDRRGDTKSARFFYARLAGVRPGDAAVLRRLADLAAHDADLEDAERRYAEAWAAGDVDAGVTLAEIQSNRDAAASVETALRALAGPATPDQKIRLAEVLIAAARTEEAAAACQSAFEEDRTRADTIIARVHAHVERTLEDGTPALPDPPGRLPLLALLARIAPVRGYPGEPYRMMMAEDHVRAGRHIEARNCLEDLLVTDVKWKAFSALARLALSEEAASRERVLKRLETVLPDAEKTGRSVWADLAYHAGLLREALGRRADAMAMFDEIVAREYKFRDVAERLDALRAAASAEGGGDRSTRADEPRTYADGRYEILALLAQGGMGRVYKARDRMLDRDVALKVIPSSGDAAAIDLIVREARTTARLNHPNIVTVYDVGREEGDAFLAIEFVDGVSLKERLKEGSLPRPEALVVARSLLGALAAAHEQGVIHRDIKPGNVMIRGGAVRAENVKLMDFGLARVTTDASLMMPGMAAGTLAYMAPEQIRGGELDGRADLYALGCLLYEMLTGLALFAGRDAASTMFQHLEEDQEKRASRIARCPADLVPFVARLVERDAARRPANAREAAEALAAFG